MRIVAPQPQSEKILAKVRDLIALASSPNEHEARNAAMLAVTLIRENGLRVTFEGTAVRPPHTDPFVRPVRIKSRFAGWCRKCNSSYDAGDDVLWLKGVGAVHAGCGWS